MADFKKAAGIFLAITVLLFSHLTGFAQNGETELAYDDGSHSLPINYRNHGHSLVGVRFTTSADSAQVLRLRFFVEDTTTGSHLKLTILTEKFEEPDRRLWGPVAIVVRKIGWNEWDLAADHVIVGQTFFVVMTLDDSSPTFGGEENQPLAYRTYFFST